MKQYSYHLFFPIGNGIGFTGTGFFLKMDSEIFLISALHIFTGIHPQTNKLFKGLTASPDYLRVTQINKKGKIKMKNYQLYDENGLSIYFETENSSFDVSALPINNDEKIENVLSVSRPDLSSHFLIYEEIFYYGYPRFGLHQNKEPIKSAGYIIDLPNKNNVHIKANLFSAEGCSGSPIFIKNKGTPKLIGVLVGGNHNFGGNETLIVPITRIIEGLKL